MRRSLWGHRLGLGVAAAGLVAWGLGTDLAWARKHEDTCRAEPECRAVDDVALVLYKDGDIVQSLNKFQEAYQLVAEPRLLVNIGRCMHRLGRSQEALDYYIRYYKAVPKPPEEMAQRLRRYIDEASASKDGDRPELPSPAAEGSGAAAIGGGRFPLGAAVLLGVGGAALAIGLGLGGAAQGAERDVVSGTGPFDQDLYDKGQSLNKGAIALDVIGGSALAAGLAWTVVWAVHKRRASAHPLALAAPLGTAQLGSAR
jgi:tetratricopeptide (TPR) repeat protein